ncbi:hypothetical protein TNIN_246561 [Trichonephila inaurata madagascariensis]|uniref:Uncharacterized protein n=1 Tax=Trichonephila inaurata madagascariensis TaxID=2747483 RepID=A0A8X6Y2W2_9ARAC|nr:hypothetical protein TNIN_246561 [Trichonephila inaurata madagascariensis]
MRIEPHQDKEREMYSHGPRVGSRRSRMRRGVSEDANRSEGWGGMVEGWRTMPSGGHGIRYAVGRRVSLTGPREFVSPMGLL